MELESNGAGSQRALFISRAGADADFAAVVSGILRDAGYTVILQQWDFANRNFMERMHAALTEGARVVALLSPEYLRSDHCQAEWQNAIAGDPLNSKSRLILLRVVECEPPGLMSGLAYWDLVPIRDDRPMLAEIVRDAVCEGRRDAVASGPYWREPRSIVDAEAIRPVQSFSGREEELSMVSAALAHDSAMAAVHGLGGVGKSSIAREYAWRNRESYSVIWWLNAQSEDAIVEGLLRVGALFVRGLDQLADRRAAAQQVVNSVLSGFSKPVLLIFDNLEDERLLRTWLPRSGARALVTSRNSAWGAEVTPIELHTWEPDAAIAYLQRESGRTDLHEADAREVVKALGALPLALSHAAASLRGMRMVTPERFLEHLNEHLKSAPRGAEYPRSVFATFSTAIAQAEKEGAGAAAVLCFAASYAPDAIPDELFRQRIDHGSHDLRPTLSDGAALDLGSALANEVHVDDALGALDRLSLLAFAEKSRTYSLHRLVQLAARDIAGGSRLDWAQWAVCAAEAAFPVVEVATWPQCERVLPHARAALDALPDEAASPEAGRLASRCAAYLNERGDYRSAELLAQRALSILERTVGRDHPDVASGLRELSTIYYHQARYADAEPLLERALEVWERQFGPSDARVAQCFNDLGVLYHRRGRSADAEPCYLRALAIQGAILGHDHPDVAATLSNLGYFYDAQGRPDDSEKANMRALAIRERVLGRDHPDVAMSLNNLGKGYFKQGRYEELEPMLLRALDISQRALGPDHPNVAHTVNNLGMLYLRQGRFEESESSHRLALAIRERALGLGHADVAISCNGLAQLNEARGRFEEAEALHRRALEIRERSFGLVHREVAATLEDIARVCERQERVDEARALLARARQIWEDLNEKVQ